VHLNVEGKDMGNDGKCRIQGNRGSYKERWKGEGNGKVDVMGKE